MDTQASSVLPELQTRQYSDHPQAVRSRTRRQYLNSHNLQRLHRIRREWIQANGPCAVCGSDDRLEVDHKNPEEKNINPRGLWGMSPLNPRRIAELAKCQVLCFACHKAKTKPFLREKALAQPSVNRTGFRGVTLERCGKFRARIYNSGQKITVGWFPTAEQAGLARAAAIQKAAQQ